MPDALVCATSPFVFPAGWTAGMAAVIRPFVVHARELGPDGL